MPAVHPKKKERTVIESKRIPAARRRSNFYVSATSGLQPIDLTTVKSEGALGDAGDAATRFPEGCVVNATQQPERKERWPRERARARRGRVRGGGVTDVE